MTGATTGDSSIENDAPRKIPVVRAQLLADLERWESELARYSLTRPTLWVGVYAKAFKEFEFLVTAATGHWISTAGERGHEIARQVSQGKPIDRLTVGQRLQVLRELDKRAFAQNKSKILGERALSC